MKKQKCFVNREILLSYIMACGSQCHQRQYRRQGTKLDRYWGITKHRKERYLRGRMLLVTLQHDLLLFYWPFQGGTSFVDLLCFCSVLCLLCFVRVCLYVLCGHLLGKGWPLGSRLWCLLWVCHFPIGILGQVWYLIESIPDLCTITYF